MYVRISTAIAYTKNTHLPNEVLNERKNQKIKRK